MVVFSDRCLVATGLLELLPADLRQHSSAVCTLHELNLRLRGDVAAAIVDGDSTSTAGAAATVRSRGVRLVLLVDRANPGPAQVAELADAVLVQQEIGALELSATLAAVASGLRVLPGSIDLQGLCATEAQRPQPALRDRTLEALALVADGARDAEIALKLNLSESAARKLVQRAVRTIDARTRCEAVAKAIANGKLA